MSAVKRIARGLGIFALVLCALEGACNLALFAYDAAFNSRRPLAERQHTRYDPEIGWVAIENRAFKDLYGPGRSLTTNSRGFRGRAEFEPRKRPGSARVVCIGDSFTLGYGVDDRAAWPQVLAGLDPRLEVANLGQGGYGVDQFLLWHRRAAAGLEYDLLVCAFIPEDFERMCTDSFLVYGKPYLQLEDDRLVVRNVPTPKRGYTFPWLAHNRPLVNRIGLVGLFNRASGPDATRRPERAPAVAANDAPRIAVAIFAELERAARGAGAKLVLVHLPSVDPRRPEKLIRFGGWPRAACEQAEAAGVRFIDLTPDFEALAPDRSRELFLGEAEVNYPSAAGHYNERGNEFVAGLVRRALAAEIDAAAR